MYLVRKGETRISLPDKESRTKLVCALAAEGCSEPITTQHIIGSKEDIDRFEVSFGDTSVIVLGQKDAETVLDWMLGLGINKVTIEKLTEDKEDA